MNKRRNKKKNKRPLIHIENNINNNFSLFSINNNKKQEPKCSDSKLSIKEIINDFFKPSQSTSPKSYSNKYSRQKPTLPETNVKKQNTQKIESVRQPLQKDGQGLYCTLNKRQLHKIRIKSGTKIYLLPKNEINDIEGYTVKINITIKEKFIKSAVLFFNNKFTEEIQVANKNILQE